MIHMYRAAILFLISSTLFIFSCAETAKLRGGIDSARTRLERVQANGAYNCAPKELALAEAHIEFASLEISQGMGSRARQHFLIAMENLNRADEKSIPEHCLKKPIPAPAGTPAPAVPGCVDNDGDRFCADKDRCPDMAEDFDGIQDDDGCPEDQDTDRDGILDSIDQCVVDPEDLDGYLDADGCPDLDNDVDGVPDSADGCPNDPEDPDGFEDTDGCPDDDNDKDTVADLEDECPTQPGEVSNKGCPKKYEGVEITETHIRINQQIFFAYNKATIKKESYQILSVVAAVLTDNPEITLSIEGHTDSRGNDAYNKKLSQKRAKSVMDHLVKIGGIAKSRLTSVGYGEEKPIDTNLTDEGRAVNRRVEFVRTDISPN